MLFEPVRKTHNAKFFKENPDGMWVPCEPTARGAIEMTMQQLDDQGLASKV